MKKLTLKVREVTGQRTTTGPLFVAVCLEYYIAAHGPTEMAAFDALMMVMQEQMAIDYEAGREPFEGFEPVPKDERGWYES